MNKRIVQLIEKAVKGARFENANFDHIGEKEIIVPGEGITDFIKDRIGLYLRDQVLWPLDEVLKTLKKRDETREKRRAKRKGE